VFDQPGITRDRMYTRTEWAGTEFVVVDTGVCFVMCVCTSSFHEIACTHAQSGRAQSSLWWTQVCVLLCVCMYVCVYEFIPQDRTLHTH